MEIQVISLERMVYDTLENGNLTLPQICVFLGLFTGRNGKVARVDNPEHFISVFKKAVKKTGGNNCVKHFTLLSEATEMLKIQIAQI